MEYRSLPDKPNLFSTYSTPPSSSGGYTYFSEQPFHMGYINEETGRRTDLVRRRDYDQLREEIKIELEKEKIREEIIAQEIIRKRALEAELSREMSSGRNLSMPQAGTERFLSSSSSLSPATWSDSRVPLHLHHRYQHPDEGQTLDRFSFRPFN